MALPINILSRDSHGESQYLDRHSGTVLAGNISYSIEAVAGRLAQQE